MCYDSFLKWNNARLMALRLNQCGTSCICTMKILCHSVPSLWLQKNSIQYLESIIVVVVLCYDDWMTRIYRQVLHNLAGTRSVCFPIALQFGASLGSIATESLPKLQSNYYEHFNMQSHGFKMAYQISKRTLVLMKTLTMQLVPGAVLGC